MKRKYRKNKYGAKKTTVDGHTFDSKAEAKRYQELKLMLRAGVIEDLELQPKFEIIPKQKDERKASYIADFKYYDKEKGTEVVEDVKGGRATQTQAYVLKRKLFKLKYPQYEFMEVRM